MSATLSYQSYVSVYTTDPITTVFLQSPQPAGLISYRVAAYDSGQMVALSSIYIDQNTGDVIFEPALEMPSIYYVTVTAEIDDGNGGTTYEYGDFEIAIVQIYAQVSMDYNTSGSGGFEFYYESTSTFNETIYPHVYNDGQGNAYASDNIIRQNTTIQYYDPITSSYIDDPQSYAYTLLDTTIQIDASSFGIQFQPSNINPGSYKITFDVRNPNDPNSVAHTTTVDLIIYIREPPSDISLNPTSYTGVTGSNVMFSTATINNTGSSINGTWELIGNDLSGISIDSTTGVLSYDSSVSPGVYTFDVVYRSDIDNYYSNGYNTSTSFSLTLSSPPQPSSGGSAVINLPFIFDLSAQSIEIFGEEVSLPDASFNLTTDLSLNVFLSSFLFKDNEAGDMDISFVDTASLKDHINMLNSTSNARTLQLVSVDGVGGPNYTQFSKVGSSFTPQDSSICNHFLQYVASLLFGHPQAQAPIKNDTAILEDLSGDDLGGQFITELSNNHIVRHSMLEQLIDADVSNERFDYSHNDTYHSYPFLDGDKIVFRVKMQGNLFVDAISSLGSSTTVTQSTISALFSNIIGIDAQNGKVSERIWKVTATLRQ
jgi:hypothetical protein